MSCCCCYQNNNSVTDLKFILDNNKDIKLQYYIGDNHGSKEFLKNIEIKKEISDFIKIINEICKTKISEDKIPLIERKLENITKTIDAGNNLKNNISDFASVLSGKDITERIIDEIFLLFINIYNNKNKINRKYFEDFINTIEYILKDEHITKKTELNKFINFLNELLLKNNNTEEENSSSINSENSSENNDNYKINIIKDESFDMPTTFSTYSKHSKKKIMKLEKENRDLKKEIKKIKKSKNKNKKLYRLRFIYNKQEYPIEIYLDENDKFFLAINKVVENYEDLEEIPQRFKYNDKIIKGSNLIKDINLDDSSKIYYY